MNFRNEKYDKYKGNKSKDDIVKGEGNCGESKEVHQQQYKTQDTHKVDNKKSVYRQYYTEVRMKGMLHM